MTRTAVIALMIQGGLIGLTAVGALLWLGLRRYVKAQIDARVRVRVEKEVETHKHELSLAHAARTFEFQQQLREFELYVTRKHEIVAQLHQLVRSADQMTDVVEEGPLSLQQLTPETMAQWMRDLGLSKKKIDATVAQSPPGTSRDELMRHVLAQLEESAEETLIAAFQYLDANEIYLSEGTVQRARRFLKGIAPRLSASRDVTDIGEIAGMFFSGVAAGQLPEVVEAFRAELAGRPLPPLPPAPKRDDSGGAFGEPSEDAKLLRGLKELEKKLRERKRDEVTDNETGAASAAPDPPIAER